MLLGSLYNTVSKNIAGFESEFTIKVDSSHPIYSGHFPGFPVTPGVVELEIVRELTGEVLDCRLRLLKISNCKFTYILNPVVVGEMQVNISIKPVDNDYKVVATISDTENTYLILKATYCLAS